MEPDLTLRRIAPDVVLGKNVLLHPFINLYGCSIGDDTRIGPFVEIQRDVIIGARCKISSHTFICSGVTIEDECFIGHHVCFCNDKYPQAARNGQVIGNGEWVCRPILVRRGAAIGSGAIILPGVKIGAGALIGAGAIVTADVQEHAIVAGCPARMRGNFKPGDD